MPNRPNILLILNDDMGYSDLGCYGGEVRTPNLDGLAAGGIRFTQFSSTPRCSPSRASLMTGLHPHQVGIGILTGYDGPDGYEGNLNHNGITLAELLGAGGYRTYMSGKWHLTRDDYQRDPGCDSRPERRGFDRYFGTLCGAGNYFSPRMIVRDGRFIDEEVRNDPDFYYTDAISDHAADFIDRHFRETPDRPFFQYVAYTAPHWPLHAKPAAIARYKGRFAAGWDELRRQRLRRMIDLGLIDPAWRLSPRDPAVPAWADAPDKPWQERRMEVYAAQIDCMDQGIGRILDALRRHGQLDNTLILFLSDNGGCAEELSAEWGRQAAGREIGTGSCTPDGRPVRYGNDPHIMPGDESTYQSYGVEWANLSNTPFRLYKHWTHEGGIATPLIVHWPAGITARGELRHQPGQLTDIMATLVDITGIGYPEEFNGRRILPMEGTSLVPVFEGRDRDVTLLFEHEGNAAVRRGRWKLVRNFTGATSGRGGFDPADRRGGWELYDMDADRTESCDVAAAHPRRVAEMVAEYEAWAARCGVIARDDLLRAAKAWRERQR